MRRLAALLIVVTLPATAVALQQQPQVPAAGPADRMAPFAWLIGEWRGSGWTAGPDGTRRGFESRELVTAKLSGAALLVEGRHHAPGQPERIVHDAIAMLVWDSRAGAFRFRTALATGMGGDFPIEPTADGFTWRIDAPGGPITYVVTHDNGRWIERGRRTLPNGRSVDFFEMTLERAR